VLVAGVPHGLLAAPLHRFQRAVDDLKAPLGRLLDGWRPGGAGYVGDDAAPVPFGTVCSASPEASGVDPLAGMLVPPACLGPAGLAGIHPSLPAALPETDVEPAAPGGLKSVAPVPVPAGQHSGLLAACDAVQPSMVERDPEWAGWCSVLVNVNDLAAMGAQPVGLLDAVAGRDEHHVRRILAGLMAAAEAYGVPVLGGHTQLGCHGSLAVTALGATREPIPSGGGLPGDDVRLIADLAGSWRPGYVGRQWDSTTRRRPSELRRLLGTVARHRPAAAKDVSMAGVIGTLAMLAEASGTGAEIDVNAVPCPAGAGLADWLTCFPGFALLTADRPGRLGPWASEVAPATAATVGRLTEEPGIRLRWPDGRVTSAVAGPATGLGQA
jgi:AIR synthase-related protein